ncbi:hypothetical protein INC34_002077 [Salmonella enterica]|nr:hypothetical protein [Salmonella enterica]
MTQFSGAFSRFIPAGAGNSVVSAAIASSISVYPRWRGELEVSNFI